MLLFELRFLDSLSFEAAAGIVISCKLDWELELVAVVIRGKGFVLDIRDTCLNF